MVYARICFLVIFIILCSNSTLFAERGAKVIAPNLILEYFNQKSSLNNENSESYDVGGQLFMSSTCTTPGVSLGMRLPRQSDGEYVVAFGFAFDVAQKEQIEPSDLESNKVGTFSYQFDGSKIIVEQWPYIGSTTNEGNMFTGVIMPVYPLFGPGQYDLYVEQSRRIIGRLKRSQELLVHIELESGQKGTCVFDLAALNAGMNELNGIIVELKESRDFEKEGAK